MKPRIYLFKTDIDFKGVLFVDLYAVSNLNIDWNSQKCFLHLGFQPPDTEEVKKSLETLPNGLYCSQSFKDANPGLDWTFSNPLMETPSDLSTLFVLSSSINSYIVNQTQVDKVYSLIEASKNTIDNIENIDNDDFLEDLLLSLFSNVFLTEA